MTKHYCDRCKVEIMGLVQVHKLRLSYNRQFMFCEGCWAKLIAALRRFMPEVGVAIK